MNYKQLRIYRYFLAVLAAGGAAACTASWLTDGGWYNLAVAWVNVTAGYSVLLSPWTYRDERSVRLFLLAYFAPWTIIAGYFKHRRLINDTVIMIKESDLPEDEKRMYLSVPLKIMNKSYFHSIQRTIADLPYRQERMKRQIDALHQLHHEGRLEKIVSDKLAEMDRNGEDV